MSQLAADSACLAIDFGGSKVAIALFESTGDISSRHRIDIDTDDDASSILASTAEACRKMLGDRVDVVIGAVSPGVVLDDRILLAPNVSGWRDVWLKRSLTAALDGRAVAVGNDVKAAAAAEVEWGALRGIDPGVYVNLGTGIAAALVIGAKVVTGANGAAGEIGYNASTRPDELLEEIVGARSIVRRAQATGLRCSSPGDVFAAVSSSPEVKSLIDDLVYELVAQLRPIVHLVDPKRIVFGGGLTGSASVFLPMLQTSLSVATGPTPELMIAGFGVESSLHGARLLGLATVEAGVGVRS
jgi:glucokinase